MELLHKLDVNQALRISSLLAGSLAMLGHHDQGKWQTLSGSAGCVNRAM
jgi:hypothetical protein